MADRVVKNVYRKTWRAAFRRDPVGTLRSGSYVYKFRFINRYQDLRAVIAGSCNATSWSDETRSYRGGFAFWRCGRGWKHLGRHRFNNYVWNDSPFDHVLYDPIKGAPDFQRYAEGRRLAAPRRQERLRRRQVEAELRKANPHWEIR